jgi:hypothetical protein
VLESDSSQRSKVSRTDTEVFSHGVADVRRTDDEDFEADSPGHMNCRLRLSGLESGLLVMSDLLDLNRYVEDGDFLDELTAERQIGAAEAAPKWCRG